MAAKTATPDAVAAVKSKKQEDGGGDGAHVVGGKYKSKHHDCNCLLTTSTPAEAQEWGCDVCEKDGAPGPRYTCKDCEWDAHG